MIGPHTYKHLDEDSKFTVSLDLKDVVTQVSSMNYGVQRFLSHLIDVRRKEHAARITAYKDRGQHEVAWRLIREGDKLANGIEKLLNEGLF